MAFTKTDYQPGDTLPASVVNELIASVMNLLEGGSGSAKVTNIDFTNFLTGSFTETVNGTVVTHTVEFDGNGLPVTIDDVTITWGDT